MEETLEDFNCQKRDTGKRTPETVFFFFWIAGGNEVFIEGDKSAFFGIIK